MSREIKFRAWGVFSKKMVLPTDADFTFKMDGGVSLYKRGEPVIGNTTHLMQYTGLKDKNGKEIYEGDIVRVFQPFNVPTRAIVELNDGCFELKGIELTWRDYVKCFVVNHAIEIIGSIHENPELLGNR